MFGVIGAGSSGLAAAKNLREAGFDVEVIEKNDDVGGNWYFGQPGSSVYKSTHLISSKPLTQFIDFPMPAGYPDYPSHWQVHQYFKDYARHFGLYDVIRFGTKVVSVTPSDDGPAPRWQVVTETSGTRSTRDYSGLVIANGHNWDPKWPAYPGTFSGTVLHSCQYKTPDVLRDRRVLVVGAGNSGCDIAVEAAQNARRTFHSTRRAYYYSPKFAFGQPSDQVNERFLKMGLPLGLQRLALAVSHKLLVGDPQNYGLPKPDHRYFETHPIINQQILYYYGQGDIAHKPDVVELKGDTVRFKDGSEEAIDVIVYATGFNIVFPFLDQTLLNWEAGRPRLFMNVFHPQRDNLFVIGLIQPDSGQWGLVDEQSRLMARFVRAAAQQTPAAEAFRRKKASAAMPENRGIKYVDSTRHFVEVEHYSYRKRLQALQRELTP
jgi:cation diffusion facilitator CzcD-associated flavoprotein CzcO